MCVLRYYADAEAQLDKTVGLERVKQEDYDTVIYPGGHRPMWDLAEDKNSIKLSESLLIRLLGMSMLGV